MAIIRLTTAGKACSFQFETRQTKNLPNSSPFGPQQTVMSFNLISVYNKADSLISQSVCLLNKFRTWTGNKGAIYCSVGEQRLK